MPRSGCRKLEHARQSRDASSKSLTDLRGLGADVEASADNAAASVILRQLSLLPELRLQVSSHPNQRCKGFCEWQSNPRIAQGGEAEGAVVDADVPFQALQVKKSLQQRSMRQEQNKRSQLKDPSSAHNPARSG